MDTDMKPKANEIILIYNSNKQRDKEAMGYAKSLENHKLNERDISKSNLTERQWAEIAEEMDVSIRKLVDNNSEKYLTELKDGDYSDEELLKLMVQNPEIIQTPIALLKDRAFFVKSQYSFVKEDLNIDGIQSDKGNEFEK